MKSFMLGISMLCVLTTACSKSSSPSNPTASATHIIRLGGNLNFGDLPVQAVRDDGVLTVSNDGNDVLHIDRIAGPCTGNGISPLSSTTFNVAPGAMVSVGFSFAPKVPINCSGDMTVFGNQTAGVNTIAVTARGFQPTCQPVPGGLLCQ